MITHERLTDLIDFDPATGKMWHKIDRKRTSIKAGDPVRSENGNISLDGKLYRTRKIAWYHYFGYYPDGNIRLRRDNDLSINNLFLNKNKPAQNIDEDILDYCARCPDECNKFCPYFKYSRRLRGEN